jgi:hypothetical protein
MQIGILRHPRDIFETEIHADKRCRDEPHGYGESPNSSPCTAPLIARDFTRVHGLAEQEIQSCAVLIDRISLSVVQKRLFNDI